jgi:hypothetical protein
MLQILAEPMLPKIGLCDKEFATNDKLGTLT